MKNVLVEKFTFNDFNLIKNNLENDFDNFWNNSILENELKNASSIYICCKYNSEIVGFAGISIILDTAELNNIVIKKSKRGNGLSSLLLEKLIKIAKSKNCKIVNLEVASNNEIAINLYKKFGFKQVGMRSKYYGEADALLYTLLIS